MTTVYEWPEFLRPFVLYTWLEVLHTYTAASVLYVWRRVAAKQYLSRVMNDFIELIDCKTTNFGGVCNTWDPP